MGRRLGQNLLLVSIIAFLAACGDSSLFMSLKTETSDLQIASIVDGQVLSQGNSVPLMISARDTAKSRDVEIEVTLSSASGASVWHNRSAATLNEQTPITLPADLAVGRYRMDFVLYSSGEVAQKKSASFFVVKDGWRIAGIKSFPPVITTTASVMLKAELEIPSGFDPYLRWSWKGKVIARGTLSKGFGQILWVAPSDQGVYTITLELFPSSPPADSDFPFVSSLLLSTDIFVTGGKALEGSDFGPESSYLTLLHLQADLADVGTGAKKAGKSAAAAIGAPQIVSLEDGFGYKLDGVSGIQIPWLALPIDNGVVMPFTANLGVSFENLAGARSILTASASDGSFSLVISVDPATGAPQALITSGGASALAIPWAGPALAQSQRYLLSLSIVPQGASLTAQWFLDGVQVSAMSALYKLTVANQSGTIAIGGATGFKGTVDEFGIYYRDDTERPSPDPDLYLRAQSLKYGNSLLFADGFDGLYLSRELTLEGNGGLSAGSLSLQTGAGLGLPRLTPGGSSISVAVDLSSDSTRTATLEAQWEGASPAAPVLIPLIADAAGFKFRTGADGMSIIVQSGAVEKTITLPRPAHDDAGLLLAIRNPIDAKGALVVAQLLVVQEKN
jgi:hypothetical protein